MFTLDKVKLYTFNPCIHLTLVILPMQFTYVSKMQEVWYGRQHKTYQMQFTYVSKMQEKVMFINESGW